MDDDDLRRGRPTCHVDVRRGRRDPRRRRPLRRGVPPRSASEQAGEPGRVLAAAARAGRRRPASTAWSAASTSTSPGRATTAPRACARLHELKTGRLIAASVGVRTAAGGHRPNLRQSRYRRFAERAGRPLPDRRRHPRRDRDRRASSASRRAATSDTASAPTSAYFGLERARELAAESPRQGARGARRGRAGERRRPRADHRLHLHPARMSDAAPTDEPAPRPHRRPAGPARPRRRAAAAGRAGGARATSSTRSARSAATSAPTSAPASSPSRCTALLDSPRDKILWDVGHQAYPHKILTGRRDRLADDPPVRGPGAVLLDRRVRARHHGRRPRLDLDRLRGRPQGGDAQGDRRGRQGRRRDRRRRDDRRRRLRGDPPGRRPADADRRSSSTTTACRSRRTSARCRATSTASA